MRIGFDAKRAFCNTTGLGNFSRSLIDSFLEFYPENDYTLYTPKKSVNYTPRAKIETPQSLVQKTFSSWWRTSGLKYQIYNNGIQLFHGMSHEIPMGLDSKIKTVVTMHDLIYLKRPDEFKFFDRLIYNQKFRHACVHADHIVAITEQTKNDIMNYFEIGKDKISVIYQSCDPLFAQNKDSYKNERPYLFYVGSLNPRKKPFELVKAFHKAMIDIDHDLILVGRGEERSKIDQYIKYHQLDNRVSFEDAKDTNELAKLYRGADLFIFPSVDEGFGIPLIEAMNSDTPVLTSPYSCLPEVAGPHSFYTEPDDTEQFASDIKRILGDKEAISKSLRANKEWLQRYSRKSIAEQYINLFEKVIKEN